MARNFAVALTTITALAPLLCLAAVFFGASTMPLLLSVKAAYSSAGSVPAVPVPQPISLRPAISPERALNLLPLWHGRTDEDVMANPPPPFFAHAPFTHEHSTLRSTEQFMPNGKVAAGGAKDDYEAMKAQYDAQEQRMRRIEKSAIDKIQPAALGVHDAPTAASDISFHAPRNSRLQRSRTFQTESKRGVLASHAAAPYQHQRAAFVHDSTFYKAANSRIGIAHFDANLASTIQARAPRLAHDLLHISASIVRRLRPRQRSASAHAAAAALVMKQQRPSVVTAPVASLQPMLPASLRHKLLPHDTSFYQAANSRAGIAKFDAHLAAEIQERRPGLSHDLKRISAAILSAPLSSLKPLLPASAPYGSQSAAPKSDLSASDQLGLLTPLVHESTQQDVKVAPSVSFVQHPHPDDYNRIFQEHSAPQAHFPQQEEAWIHFAASGASFGGDTKEQREAVKKVKKRAVSCVRMLSSGFILAQVRSLARQYFKDHDGAKAAVKGTATTTAVAPLLAT
jgi:hypothetical protein